jgi:hypothetical protein
MKKQVMCSILCVVFILACAAAFADEYVMLRPTAWVKKPYGSQEWDDNPDSHGTVDIGNDRNAQNDAYARRLYGAHDKGYKGNLAHANHASYNQYYAGTAFEIGSTKWKYRRGYGEGRVAYTYNLMNPFGWVRYYDNSYLSPSATFTTGGYYSDPQGGVHADDDLDGWDMDDFGNTTTGPARQAFRGDEIADMYTGGWGYYNPVHFHLDNTTDTGTPISMNSTIKRMHLVLGWTPYFYTREQEDCPEEQSPGVAGRYSAGPCKSPYHDDTKKVQLVHTQPPVAQMIYDCLDNVWGSHSNGSDYFDRVVMRESMGNLKSGVDAAGRTTDWAAFGVIPYGDGHANALFPNNYPTSRQGTSGIHVIDEIGGAVNDQWTYTPGGENDPLINSFIADMREGRPMVWFTARAYRFYKDFWLQDEHYFVGIIPYRHCAEGTIFARFGPPATAEDWVLYK